MLVSITTTHIPATDLGYLLVKFPGRTHKFDLPFGDAYVTYTEATSTRCTAQLIVDVNPVELVRGREGSVNGGTLDAYVNDKPYSASSILAVALRRVYSSALAGQSKDRPELAKTPIPLECTIAALPSRRGPQTIHELFEPLGYEVSCHQHPLDPVHPEWGESHYHTVTIKGVVTVQALMTHLFILIPVLDDDKHYFVGDAEVDKLLRHAGPWLNDHPLNGLIVHRYLRNKRQLANKAMEALAALRSVNEPEDGEEETVAEQPRVKEQELERQLSLHQQRHHAVLQVLKARGVKSVVDMGCGGGLFIKALMDDEQFQKVVGVEVSGWAVEKGRDKLRLRKQERPDRVRLIQGSVTYRDSVLTRQKFDAAVSIEVIEHIEPHKLDIFALVLLGDVRPVLAVVTTPNIEYNCRFPFLPASELRHKDHRFEWTRAEFQDWCRLQAVRFGYLAEFLPVGPVDPEVGAPSQMCVFHRNDDVAVVLPPMDNLPCIEELLAGRRVETELCGAIEIYRDNARAAFETVNRFGVDPRWLIYVPPTMSPCETAAEGSDYLEYPGDAFDHFARHGIKKVVCERKHMGSRAVVVVCKDQSVARNRFGIDDPLAGCCYTRMGRRFFNDDVLEQQFIASVRQALTDAGIWDELQTGWVAMDCELMPWSAKARDLIRRQYAAPGAAATAALPLSIDALRKAVEQGQDVAPLLQKTEERLVCVQKFRAAYNQYCWPAETLSDYQLAPFHLLASEGAVHNDKDHTWHMETLARVARASNGLVIATPCRVVDLTDPVQQSEAVNWWKEMTDAGGEGMVVKPLSFVAMDEHGPLQPAVKVRGREYLRIIYGPDYTMESHLQRLRQRGLRTKRRLALREFALGMESLCRFVQGESLARVHEPAFAVLALETECCDPRL